MQNSPQRSPSDPAKPIETSSAARNESSHPTPDWWNSLDLPPLAQDPVVQRAKAKVAAGRPPGRLTYLIDSPMTATIAEWREFLVHLESLPQDDPGVWSAQQEALQAIAIFIEPQRSKTRS